MPRKAKTKKSNRPKPTPPSISLDEQILCLALEPLRQSAIRRRIRSKTGASDATIEEKLNSSRARQALRNVVAASFVERTAAALSKLFAAAEKKEAWACKVVLEVARVAEAFEAGAEVTLPSAEEFGVRSAVEHSVVENILSLMRGENHESQEGQPAGE